MNYICPKCKRPTPYVNSFCADCAEERRRELKERTEAGGGREGPPAGADVKLKSRFIVPPGRKGLTARQAQAKRHT